MRTTTQKLACKSWNVGCTADNMLVSPAIGWFKVRNKVVFHEHLLASHAAVFGSFRVDHFPLLLVFGSRRLDPSSQPFLFYNTRCELSEVQFSMAMRPFKLLLCLLLYNTPASGDVLITSPRKGDIVFTSSSWNVTWIESDILPLTVDLEIYETYLLTGNNSNPVTST